MKMNETCRQCLLDKNLGKVPAGTDAAVAAQYAEKVRRIVMESGEESAPEIVEMIDRVHDAFFGAEDFSDLKHHFNALMLSLEQRLHEKVGEATDAFAGAIRYAMVGNFIDFGAMDSVDEGKLLTFLDSAEEIEIDAEVLEAFRKQILDAESIVYFTDNCGEIVCDKVLLSVIRTMNPTAKVTAIVRGAPVFNDATMADALQIGLQEVADEVLDNGSAIPGNVVEKLSGAAKAAVEQADVLIAKGQGNYESLSGCGLNIFYIFMCKCRLFVERFDVPLYSGILTSER